jgi:hypothetical protein
MLVSTLRHSAVAQAIDAPHTYPVASELARDLLAVVPLLRSTFYPPLTCAQPASTARVTPLGDAEGRR